MLSRRLRSQAAWRPVGVYERCLPIMNCIHFFNVSDWSVGYLTLGRCLMNFGEVEAATRSFCRGLQLTVSWISLQDEDTKLDLEDSKLLQTLGDVSIFSNESMEHFSKHIDTSRIGSICDVLGANIRESEKDVFVDIRAELDVCVTLLGNAVHSIINGKAAAINGRLVGQVPFWETANEVDSSHDEMFEQFAFKFKPGGILWKPSDSTTRM